MRDSDVSQGEDSDDSIYLDLINNFDTIRVTNADDRAMIDTVVQVALMAQAKETANRENSLRQDFESQVQQPTANTKQKQILIIEKSFIIF